MNSRGFHVYAALEASLGLEAIREALPAGTPLRAVSLAEAGSSGSEIQQGADLVIVGCAQAQDRALEVISAANAQRADRPVVVLYQGSPNGFLERAFEAGADDLVSLPQASGQLGFAFEKALARSHSAVASSSRATMITVLGPEGRHRQNGDLVQPGGGAVARGQVLGARRPRPPVRRHRAGARARADEDDLRPGHVGRNARRRQGHSFLARHPSGARALLAPLRPDQAAAITTAFLREVFEILRSRFDFVLVDTPPAFSARGDHGGRRDLAPAHGRDARRALAEGHQDRPRDARGDGVRPAGDHARAQPCRLERGHHPGSTSSSCSAARRTYSSAATGRSPVHSRAGSRSSSPSRSRRRPGRTPRSQSATWRSRVSR